MQEYYTHVHNDTKKGKVETTYRFFGSSFRGENNNLYQPEDSRFTHDYNMLMFIVEDVEYSDKLVRKAVSKFAVTKIDDFKWLMIFVSVALMILVTAISLLILNSFVVKEVKQLTQAITSPQIEGIKAFKDKIINE